uniref:Uncharacterized protein n=1 Tax=Opuntia streptacantha TaxID=393608 RepID=A0A7C9CH47_OPUST
MRLSFSLRFLSLQLLKLLDQFGVHILLWLPSRLVDISPFNQEFRLAIIPHTPAQYALGLSIFKSGFEITDQILSNKPSFYPLILAPVSPLDQIFQVLPLPSPLQYRLNFCILINCSFQDLNHILKR